MHIVLFLLSFLSSYSPEFASPYNAILVHCNLVFSPHKFIHTLMQTNIFNILIIPWVCLDWYFLQWCMLIRYCTQGAGKCIQHLVYTRLLCFYVSICALYHSQIHACLMKTNKAFENPVLVEDHSHAADRTAVDVEQCGKSMKRKASSTNDKPNKILMFSTSTATDYVKTRLPFTDTLKRVLRRARAANRTVDPQTLRELTINGIWSHTSVDKPFNFICYDNGPEADGHTIMFATEGQLHHLAASDIWVYGWYISSCTTSVSSALCNQWTSQRHLIHLAYALLQGRTHTAHPTLWLFYI